MLPLIYDVCVCVCVCVCEAPKLRADVQTRLSSCWQLSGQVGIIVSPSVAFPAHTHTHTHTHTRSRSFVRVEPSTPRGVSRGWYWGGRFRVPFAAVRCWGFFPPFVFLCVTSSSCPFVPSRAPPPLVGLVAAGQFRNGRATDWASVSQRSLAGRVELTEPLRSGWPVVGLC